MRIVITLILAMFTFAASAADTFLECRERAGKSGVKEEIIMNIALKKNEVTVYLHRGEARIISFDTKRVLETSSRTGAWQTFDNGLSTLQIEASGSIRRAYFEKPLKCFEID